MDSPASDRDLLARAVACALEAEARGDMPIGCVIALEGHVIAEGGNRLLSEGYQPRRHAEQEALARVPAELWPRAAEMTCVTTLEPCLMCFGTLLLCGVGRVVFGAHDTRGGARFVLDHLPPYYADGRGVPAWEGPLDAATCDPLYHRADARFASLPAGDKSAS